MTGGLQTALALSLVALAAIYLAWKALGLIRTFFAAAKGRGGGSCGGGCGTGRQNSKSGRVELVRLPPPGEKSDS